MANDFQGKTYVVTGASSGMGYNVAASLLRQGANVHLIDLKPLDTVNHVPYPTGPGVGKFYTHVPVDISSREQVHAAFEKIFAISPEVHGLTNSAGYTPIDPGMPPVPTDETLHKTININLFGNWHCTTELLNHIMATREPIPKTERVERDKLTCSVVNVGSLASIIGISGVPHFCGAKHAVLGFTRAFAKDFAQYGVRVNVVLPGTTLTPPARAVMNGDAGESVQKDLRDTLITQSFGSPMRRFGEPEEIADAILYLLSDKSSYVTGQHLVIDGGLTY